MPDSPEYYRRHLPHWQPHGAVFFVTFRLKFSLPGKVIARLRDRERARQKDFTDGQLFAEWDAFLDKAEAGPRWLARADVAAEMKEALLHRDGREYTLYAFCIMPNHVHAVFEPLPKDSSSEAQLNQIMRSLKGSTARQANIILGRKRGFWQDETYDRVVRDHSEFTTIVSYILDNPVKAGLASVWSDWPWTYCTDGLL